jgi:hypothetical protein
MSYRIPIPNPDGLDGVDLANSLYAIDPQAIQDAITNAGITPDSVSIEASHRNDDGNLVYDPYVVIEADSDPSDTVTALDWSTVVRAEQADFTPIPAAVAPFANAMRAQSKASVATEGN